jgi:hypothetical protein
MTQKHAVTSLILVSWPLIVGFSLMTLGAVSGTYPLITVSVVIGSTCLGFGLFATAKLSVIRRGKFISFGTKEMTPVNRLLYRLGYLLMIGSWTWAGIALVVMAIRLR